MSQIRLVPPWLKRLLTTPAAELSRWQYATRFLLELGRHGAQQLREHRATQMAAALAFRTIFGLIPVFVIATLLFRAYGGAATVGDFSDRLLNAANLFDVAGPTEGATLGEWTRETITRVNANISAKAIGLIGALVLAWAAISLLTTVERCFNTICHAHQHRSLQRRVPLYWMTMTIGPALLYLSFVVQNRFVSWVESAGIAGSFAGFAGGITAFVVTWLFLFALYELIPHTKVKIGAALAGAFVGALFWTVATEAFNAYLGWSFRKESSTFTLLYSSLGLIPLFMFWIYMLWLIVLYGLELTSLFQFVGNRLEGEIPQRAALPPLTDPVDIVPVVQVIADRFARGERATIEEIVERTQVPEPAVELMVQALVAEGLLHRVSADDESALVLSKPAETIGTSDLLRIAHALSKHEDSTDNRARAWVQQFHQAQLDLGVHRPLTEL